MTFITKPMPFNFNLYSSLLLPFFLQGILFFLLLMWRGFRQQNLADRILAVLILLFTIRIAQWMLGFAGWYDGKDGYTTFMYYMNWNWWWAYGPLLYFYFRSLTNPNWRPRRKDWLHFIPFLIFFLWEIRVFIGDVVIDHWIGGQAFENDQGTHGRLRAAPGNWIHGVLVYLRILHILGYWIFVYLLYKKYRSYTDTYFSETSQITFQWFRNFLIFFIVGFLMWWIYQIGSELGWITPSYVMAWYPYLLWGIVIYYLSLAGYSVHPRFTESLAFLAGQEQEDKEADGVPDTSNLADPLIKKLENHMASARPYLQPELNLNDLARQLDVSASQLSRSINQSIGKNFNDYINHYRVEAVKAKIQDPTLSHLSLLGIALDSGFNSKATFNRVFRKFTGQTPTQFAASLK